MNKYILLLIAVAFNLTVVASNKPYTIKGTIKHSESKGDYIYLSKWNLFEGEMTLIDSTAITDNQFMLTGETDETPSIGFLSTDLKDENPLLLVLEPGNITVDIDGHHLNTGGTTKNEELNNFQKNVEKITNKYIEDIEKRQFDPQNAIQINLELKKELYNYIQSNINNPIGESWLSFSNEILSFGEVRSLLKEASPEFLNSPTGKSLTESYADVSFIDIIGENPNNESIKLSDYVSKNKYTLVDYWASWCAPCRKEMPNLVNLYNKYKDKGFEIVGISLDMDKDSWTTAINKMGMVWPQMSDLKGWQSELAKPYQITSIPFTMLIDQNGNVIGKRLSLVELDKELEKLLK